MADPKQQLITFPLAVGLDNVSLDEVVQPTGQGARVRMSRNTRLSKVPGMVSKAPGATMITSGLGSNCYGIVPIDGRESTAVFLGGKTVSKRVAGTAIGEIVTTSGGNYQQDGYVATTVDSAGYLPGGTTNFNVASAYQTSTGYTYYAWIDGRQNNGANIYVCVVARDGRVIAQDTNFVASSNSSPTSTSNWVGLSALGSKVHVWCGQAGFNFINAFAVNLSADLKLTLGTGILVYTPVSVPSWGNVALAYDPDDTTYVYFACRNSATANSVTVQRLDVTGSFPSPSGSATHAIGGAWDTLSIAYRAGDCVLLAVSLTGGTTSCYELNRTTLAQTWVATGRMYRGVVGCGFYYYKGYFDPVGSPMRVFACSRLPTTTPTSVYGTWVEAFTVGGVAFTPGGGYLQNQFLCGQVCTHKISAEEYYALIPTVTLYASSGSYDPTTLNFVSEPSVEIYRSADYYMLSCVAKIGTDSVIRYPGTNVSGTTYTLGGLNSCLINGDQMLVTYLSENTEEGLSPEGYRARYAWLNLGSKQPQYAHAPGGAALIAGGLPAVWDGREITEHSPLKAPIITVANSGVGSPWSGTGATYLFAAVMSWRDSTGRIHRGAPSNVASLTGTGVRPYITVFVPKAYRRTDPSGAGGGSHEWATVTVYVSEPNGLVLYAQNYGIQGYYNWNDVFQPVVSAFNPALYSDGSATQELASYCPNAVRAYGIVADRVWAIDGERPGRAWYTKPIVTGFNPEFNPDQYVDFPAAAGELLRVVDLNGSPLFVATGGLFTVSGEGPDNLLNPPLFSSAAQVSDIGCTQASSVVKTPAGILYVYGSRFVVFQGGPKIETGVDALAYGTIVNTAVFRDQQEVVFFTSQGYAWVYNWQIDGWSLWDPTVTGVTSLVACAQIPTSGKVLYAGDAGELWLMDPATVSTTAQISITTGWISLGGPHDRNNVDNLLLHARRGGAHGVQIQIATDYDATTVDTKTWTASEVLACVTDATTSFRYDLYPQPKNAVARAVQLTFTETGATGEAFQPVHCTIDVLKQQGKDLRGIRDSARK